MIQIFRNFFSSKLGIAVTLAFLGLIAVAFASGDVANTGSFGGLSSDEDIAVVGERRLSASEATMNAGNQLDRARASNPTLTMEGFVAQGGLDALLEQMVQRAAIAEFAEQLDLRAGDRLIDSEIVQLPGFTNVSGEFDSEAFRANLRQRGLNEALVRKDLGLGLLARQLALPVGTGVKLPRNVSLQYARLLGERRKGSIAALPAAAFAPTGAPTDAQLQSYYDANRADYIRPERRVLRYALLNVENLGNLPAPTEAQIARRYERDKQSYATIERRAFTRLVVPTEAAAKAVVDEVKAGKSLEQSAQEKGLVASPVTLTDKASLVSESSQAVADAGFAAARGAISAPARGRLGWYVQRVDRVEVQQGRNLAQASDEIRAQLQLETRAVALTNATTEIEDELAKGRSLSEVAEQYGLTIETTQPITAAGQVYLKNETAPQILAPVIEVAFEMDEAEPQLAEAQGGQGYLVFDVSRITESSTAPLAEIREAVTMGWRREQGMKKAGEAATRVIKKMREGSSLADALSAEKVPLPRALPVNLTRPEISQGGQVPRALMLLFSMAADTQKRLQDEQSSRWYVIELESIETPELEASNQIVAQASNELSGTAAEEYIDQFIKAARKSLDVEVNDAAIEALKAQLSGSAG